MARSKSKSLLPLKETDMTLVEVTITVNPRGRSVVHGTLLVAGELRRFDYTLSEEDKTDLFEFMSNRFWVKSISRIPGSQNEE